MHHRHRRPTHHLHGIRVLLFGVLVGAVFLVRVDPGKLTAVQNSNVLAYATSMSRGDLLAATNAARAQNGLGGLTLDGQLNNASQAKAQHMIDYNYWSHVAPDGTQPWYFFDQAGYVYRTAGENLAYGFTNSQATVDAWMNSSSHRANILGDYVDVGFGIVNGPSYQGGQNTVVVAHYGTRQAAPAPVAPAAPVSPPAPAAPTAPATPLPPAPATAAPVAETAEPTTPAPANADELVVPEQQKETTETVVPAPVNAASTRGVNVFQSLMSGNIPPLALASISMTIVAAMGFALTHRSLVSHAVANGERFVVKHPMFDTAIVGVVAVLILSTTISRIG